MSHTIIHISREFGSGGRIIGEKLAAELNIPFYDKTIIEMVAKKSGLPPELIEQSETLSPTAFGFDLESAVYYTSITDETFFAQSAVIREIASKGSCVIIGRCADYVLRDEPGLVKIFVRSPIEERARFAVSEYKMSPDKIESRLKKIDKDRANYYKFYTTQAWGDMKNYDLVINSAHTGIDKAVELIKMAVE